MSDLIVQAAYQIDLPQSRDLPLCQLAHEHLAVICRQGGFVAKIVALGDIGADDRWPGAEPYDAVVVCDEELQRHVVDDDHLSGARGEVEMRRVALPLVFQYAQRLVDRQQLTTQLFLECHRIAEQLGAYARPRFAAVFPERVARAKPGERHKQECRDDHCGASEAAKCRALRRRLGAPLTRGILVLVYQPLLGGYPARPVHAVR